MVSYYTPFLTQAGAAIGEGLAKKGEREREKEVSGLVYRAYMGDQAALAQLMTLDPEIGMQVSVASENRKDKEEQRQIEKETREEESSQKRGELFKDEYDRIMSNIAKYSSFEEAKEYGDSMISYLSEKYPEIMKQVGADEVFDEDDFRLAKKINMKVGAVNRKDFTQESWEKYEKTGNQSDLVPAKKEPLVNVDLRKQDPFTAEVSKQFGKEFVAERQNAMDAVKSLESANEAVSLLNSGVITGTGANFILGVGKALKRAGVYDGEALANTEAFYANQAVQVASIIKAFGAGTGLSDADREYAEKAAAGKITMTEESIRKIIDLNARASARVIERFNKKAEEVNKSGKIPFSLVVPVPGMPEANIESPQTQEEYDSLPSGATYISPADGKKYRKP